MLRSTLLTLSFVALSTAHTTAWAPGMYCRNGTEITEDNPNTNLAVNPLYNLAKQDWWFQHDRGCDKAPPNAGEYLELSANGKVTVELAHNRAFTTLSYNGEQTSDWPDGEKHPENWNGWNTNGTPAVCLKEDGAMHTYNETSAGGTAFAISYKSNLEDVNMENLVVFTTRYHTPWKRLAIYDVPDLPACPEGGCTCAWLWVPNGCGQANMSVLSKYQMKVMLMSEQVYARLQMQRHWCLSHGQTSRKGPRPGLLRERAREMCEGCKADACMETSDW
jgi:hypothetical protein